MKPSLSYLLLPIFFFSFSKSYGSTPEVPTPSNPQTDSWYQCEATLFSGVRADEFVQLREGVEISKEPIVAIPLQKREDYCHWRSVDDASYDYDFLRPDQLDELGLDEKEGWWLLRLRKESQDTSSRAKAQEAEKEDSAQGGKSHSSSSSWWKSSGVGGAMMAGGEESPSAAPSSALVGEGGVALDSSLTVSGAESMAGAEGVLGLVAALGLPEAAAGAAGAAAVTAAGEAAAALEATGVAAEDAALETGGGIFSWMGRAARRVSRALFGGGETANGRRPAIAAIPVSARAPVEGPSVSWTFSDERSPEVRRAARMAEAREEVINKICEEVERIHQLPHDEYMAHVRAENERFGFTLDPGPWGPARKIINYIEDPKPGDLWYDYCKERDLLGSRIISS